MTPASFALSAARLPPLPDPLPEGWVFTEDDDMGHGFDQLDFLLTLTSLLRLFFDRQGKKVFVGSDQHIGIDPRDRRLTVAPDVYVLPQPEPPAADGATWYPWEHHGLVPTLAFEFVSRSNRKKDYLVAPDKYAHLGVQELVIFEPWKHQPGLRAEGEVETLRVFRLDEKRQWRQVYGGDGPTRSQVLGLWLHETSDGKLLLTEDRWGKRALLTPEETLQVEQEARRLAEERAEQEAKRAEEEAKRAEQATKRAEQATRRAEQATRRAEEERGEKLQARQQAEEAARQVLEAKAEAVLAVLAARGLKVSEAQARKVRTCADLAALDRWFQGALSATSAAVLLRRAPGEPRGPSPRGPSRVPSPDPSRGRASSPRRAG
jgi:Uma2 family endonuclease